jgi:hypothetical protein
MGDYAGETVSFVMVGATSTGKFTERAMKHR